MTGNTTNNRDLRLILALGMRKLLTNVLKKKTLKDSYKTPFCFRDNSLKLKNVCVKKGLIYFNDIKETKLK